MEVDNEKMKEYANFLQDNSRGIIALCNLIEESLTVAKQCMDQQSGQGAAARLQQNIENIKANVPISDNANQRLELALKYLIDLDGLFGKGR
jgi:predicted negative regulator of RcsB-dependent stress response